VNTLELIGFAFGIIGVYLTLRENILCFPTGLINVGVSSVLFYEQHLFADTLQQLVYIPILLFGWNKWRQKQNQDDEIIGTLRTSEVLNYSLITVLFAVILGYLFRNNTTASIPWIDSAATSASFLAQYLIARKKIENWIIWIAISVLYVGIYIYKDLPLYAILFFIYLLLAISGYRTWKKQLVINQA